MKFSSQEEYGLRCLLNMARNQEEGQSRSIQEISRDEGLSASYVGKLMRLLRLGGFVESVRGMEGGYTLARPANEILVGNVLTTLGGRLYEPDFCEKYPGVEDTCTHTASCNIRPLWSMLQTAIDNALGNMTLEDLLNENRRHLNGVHPPTEVSGATLTPSRLVILQK